MILTVFPNLDAEDISKSVASAFLGFIPGINIYSVTGTYGVKHTCIQHKYSAIYGEKYSGMYSAIYSLKYESKYRGVQCNTRQYVNVFVYISLIN